MRAITQHTVGGPSVLELVEADCPEPTYGQVLIRTGAIGVNPVDGQVRSGELAMLGEPPFTVGWDIAGTVEAAGPGVSAFAPGDEVLGMPALPGAGNTYAEYVLASVNEIVHKPAGLTMEQAAGLPMAASPPGRAWSAWPGSSRGSGCWCTGPRAGWAIWPYRSPRPAAPM
ncbi:alcohol dehydrogenase catalytic domain-containing protein [Streptomyces indonesiensis]